MPTPRLLILHVERDAQMRDHFSETQKAWHDVVSCLSVEEAERHMQELDFDVVVTDISLDHNDHDGERLATKLSYGDVPPVVILLSTYQPVDPQFPYIEKIMYGNGSCLRRKIGEILAERTKRDA